MSAAAETINVEEKLSGSTLNGRQDGSPDGTDNLFAPDNDSELYLEENGTSNGSEQSIDPRVRHGTTVHPRCPFKWLKILPVLCSSNLVSFNSF